MLSRLIPDRFVLLLLGAIFAGWLVPIKEQGLEIARMISNVSIFALFFLHGLRLPRDEVVKATRSGDALWITSFRRLSRDAAARDAEVSRVLRGERRK